MAIFAAFLAGLGSVAVSNVIAGASLFGTTIMSLALAPGRGRTIGIEVSNLFSQNVDLIYTGNYLFSGVEYTPPQPTVRAGNKEGCTFAKTSDTARGTVGVMVYKVLAYSTNTSTSQHTYIVMMWSIPYDYVLYSNWFAVGIRDDMGDHNIDEVLWNDMYYEQRSWFRRRNAGDGRPCRFTLQGVEVVATLSNVGNAVMRVEVKPSSEVMRLYFK